jgi:hypothetical protein
MASFYEKCDAVLLYLKEESSGQRHDLIIPIKLKELEERTGVTFSDEVLNFLINDKKYIIRQYGQSSQLFYLTSLGMSFISHSSFVKDQEKLDAENILKWYQTENAKQVFKDYPKVNNRAKLSLLLSILAVIIAGLTLLIKWQCNS